MSSLTCLVASINVNVRALIWVLPAFLPSVSGEGASQENLQSYFIICFQVPLSGLLQQELGCDKVVRYDCCPPCSAVFSPYFLTSLICFHLLSSVTVHKDPGPKFSQGVCWLLLQWDSNLNTEFLRQHSTTVNNNIPWVTVVRNPVISQQWNGALGSFVQMGKCKRMRRTCLRY